MSGAFGSFEAHKDFGVKRYIMGAADAGTISHAWTERCVLDYMTRLCSEMSPKLDFLSNHVAKFKGAYVEKPHDVACLKMERVMGMELNERLAQSTNGLSDKRTVKMCCELIQTLAMLHECGVAHRDLKLDNVMVKADGTPVLIDWGTANIGDRTRESKVICGTRQANSIQQLAVEAFIDGNLHPALRALLFRRKKPSYDMKANDSVQLAHMLSALWTSCATKGEVTCGAFGPDWDEAAEAQPASYLALMLHEIYAQLDSNPVYALFPAPFRAIIAQLVHPEEDERLTAMDAWRKLWNAGTFTGPCSGKLINLRSYLEKPPTKQFMEACKTKLQHIADADKFSSKEELSARDVLLRWETRELVDLPERTCSHAPSTASLGSRNSKNRCSRTETTMSTLLSLSFLGKKSGSRMDSYDDASTAASSCDCKASLASPQSAKKRSRASKVADTAPGKRRKMC
eukprot:GEMP01018867.1.p1 GENE.GEMP01018867.1~~GEMP01018867.1.p1  ORF type:complete len:458 (-),score=137.99 GEMP01018867.1:1193-2566(-)